MKFISLGHAPTSVFELCDEGSELRLGGSPSYGSDDDAQFVGGDGVVRGAVHGESFLQLCRQNTSMTVYSTPFHGTQL